MTAVVCLVFGLATAVATAVTIGAVPAGSTGPPVAYQLNPGHTGATNDPRGPDWTPAWTANLSNAVSYPVIADGRVFVLSGTAAATLSAYDAATGVIDWTVAVGNEPTGLAYDEGQLFEQSGAVMSAFDPATGAENWTSTLPYQYFFSAAPTAEDGIVYIDGAAGGGTLYAVSETTGALLWAAQTNGNGDSSPAVDASGVYESFGCDLTDDHDPQSGALLWQFQTGCEGGGGQTPVLAGGDLYLRDRVLNAATGASVATLDAGPAPAVDATNIYSENGGVLQAQTIGTGEALWAFTGDGTLDTAPIVDDGVVYEGAQDGDLYGLSAATGQLLWTTKLASPISAPPYYGDDSFWGLAEGDGLLAIPDGDNLVVFSQTAAPPAARWR